MQIVAVVVLVILLVACALHLLWAFSPWPFSTREQFFRTVMGESSAPSWAASKAAFAAACVVVVLLIMCAMALVAESAGLLSLGLPRWIRLVGVSGVAVVFLLRGVVGLVAMPRLMQRQAPEFLRWDRRLYSPLFIALGAAVSFIAIRSF